MTTIVIEDSGVQANKFIDYVRTLPFATVVETKKKGFFEASEECNAVSVDTFFDKLDERIKRRFNA
jgi:hypothetical protein